MQGCTRIRSYLLSVVITAALTAGAAGTARAEEGARVVGSGLPGTTGLALDGRGNAYTVNHDAGLVLCVPPNGDPVVYAKVDNPTALAVDRLRTVFVGTGSGEIFAVMLDGGVCRVFACGSRVSGLSLDRDGNLLVATGKGAILRVPREELDFSN